MQDLPLRGQRLDDGLGLVQGDRGRGEDELDLLVAPQLLRAPARRQRRDGLEPPLLVGDAAEGVVAIVDDLALPAGVLLLPLGPLLGGEGDGLVDVAGILVRGGNVEALGVEERAPRGDGQQVESHHDEDGDGDDPAALELVVGLTSRVVLARDWSSPGCGRKVTAFIAGGEGRRMDGAAELPLSASSWVGDIVGKCSGRELVGRDGGGRSLGYRRGPVELRAKCG